jgi:hypothetical protein
VSVNFAYFRRIYGNFSVTDNTLVGPQDYTSYCVTEPADARLPGGGGERICGLQDLNTNKVGQLDRVTTFASNFGAQYEHWNGFDFTMNARLSKLLLQGGVSSGRTFEDFCDVAANVPESNDVAQPSFASGNSRGFVNSTLFCRTESPLLTQLKLLGAYTLPYGIQVSGTFQSVPGPEVTALGTFANAQVAPSLGRNLSSATTVNVAMVEPKTQYGERMNQLDFRFAKKFNVNRSKLQATIDLYNALNGNAVLVQSNNYGATIGATAGSAWLRPQAILPARIVKFSIQANF